VVELPLFPLSTVLYPGQPLPLHIFEDRYRQMFARVLEGDRRFGVVSITRGRETHVPGVDDEPDWASVGCVAEIREVRPYEDGRMDVVARGAGRFQVAKVVQPSPYIVADVAPITDDPVDDDARARAGVVLGLFRRYLGSLLTLAGEEPADIDAPGDPVAVSWLVAAGLQIDQPDKQRLLGILATAERLTAESRLLRRELALLDRLQTAGPAPMAGPFSLN
jgi:Lon protease-like protein